MNFDYLFKSYNISKQNKFECNHVNKLTLNIKVKEKKLYYIYIYVWNSAKYKQSDEQKKSITKEKAYKLDLTKRNIYIQRKQIQLRIKTKK